MKALKIYLFAALAVILMSCGGSSMNPVSEKIQGPLGDYFEVVDRDYKPNSGKVSIEIKRIKEGFPAPWMEGMEVGCYGGYFEPLFSVEYQDADGNVLGKDAADIVFEEDELKAIAALNVGESATITFDCDEKDVKKFKVSSTFEVHMESSDASSASGVEVIDADDLDVIDSNDLESTSDGTSSSSSSSSSSEDWDAVLDSYESYVDQYISFAKKAAKGDMSALAEYPSLMSKAQELSDKLNNAKSDLSASQAARYARISAKMVEAAASMN